MSCTVQQRPHVRLVSPRNINNQHAYRQTETVEQLTTLVTESHRTYNAAGNRRVRLKVLTCREANAEWFHTNVSTTRVSEAVTSVME